MFVLSPAVVEKAENGWALREPGAIEIKGSTEALIESQEQPSIVCKKCGTQAKPRHTFCKRCGSPLQSDEPSQPKNPVASDVYHDYPLHHLAEPTANTSSEFQTPSAPNYHWKPIFAVVGGLATVGIILVVIIALSVGGNSVKRNSTAQSRPAISLRQQMRTPTIYTCS